MDSLDIQIQSIITDAERNGDKRPTLREIAEATGVSAQTVSNRLRKMDSTYTGSEIYMSKSKEKAENNKRLGEELVEYIERFKGINGTIPTRRQMMKALNIKSVGRLYQILESAGYTDGDESKRCATYGDKPKQVYRYIKEYKCMYGKSPSITQIVKETDCTSGSEVLKYIAALERIGALEIDINILK